MLKLLNAAHFRQLENLDLDRKLIVYCGFSNDFILEVTDKYPLFSDRALVFDDFNQLRLDEIQKSEKRLAEQFFKGFEGTKVLLYEELLVLLTNINYGLVQDSLIIIKNTVSDIMPNPTNQDFPDIDEGLYKGKISDQPLLSFFYTDSYHQNGVNYVQPRSYKSIIDEEITLKELDFFDIPEITNHKLRFSTLAKKPDNYVIADQDDNSDGFTEFKASLNTSTPLEVPIYVRDSPEKISVLNTLQAIYELIGLELVVFDVKKETVDTNLRKDLNKLFQDYWGHAEFRNLEFYKYPGINSEKYIASQADLVEDIIEQSLSCEEGKDYSDIFITAPTGAGKSLIFQLPAMYLAEKREKLTIVISPLIALMRDQVESLKHKKIDYAAFLNSELTPKEKDETLERIKSGAVSIVYLSPELLLSYSIETFIGDRELGLLVIDEAHLVTTWGRDFRADYWYIGNYIKRARKMYELKFPMIALTATAVYDGPEDIVFATIASLNMHAEKMYIGNVRRDEIHFEIKQADVEGSHDIFKQNLTIKRIQEFIDNDKKAIVYFPWKNQIRETYAALPDDYRIRVGKYFSDLDKNEKDQTIRDFSTGRLKVVLATKAFGMGVDVSDIDVVYHHAASGSITDYIQEIGRVARDRKRTGVAQSDFNKKDLKYVKILYGLSAVRPFQLRAVLSKIFEIYNIKKEQNFLISTEDFAYLFDSNRDGENQVKSALLLIEKDFIDRFQFPIVLARPKSLFSQVFCCVESEAEEHFLSKYGKYVRRTSSMDQNRRREVSGTTVKDYGNIFTLDLDKLWEDQFVDITFAQLKRSFFNKELFADIGDVSPRYDFNISLRYDFEKAADKLEYYLTCIKKVVGAMGDQYHTDHEIADLAYGIANNRHDARKIVNILITLYVSHPTSLPGNKVEFDTFLQSRRSPNSSEYKYRVYESLYSKSEYWLRKRFTTTFNDNQTTYNKFINTADTANPNLKLAFALEILGIANYQLSGGRLPKIFIRVNDPYKLKNICDRIDQYTNGLLENIKSRQQYGVDKMEEFLLAEASDKERWDMIEDYFLNINR